MHRVETVWCRCYYHICLYNVLWACAGHAVGCPYVGENVPIAALPMPAGEGPVSPDGLVWCMLEGSINDDDVDQSYSARHPITDDNPTGSTCDKYALQGESRGIFVVVVDDGTAHWIFVAMLR